MCNDFYEYKRTFFKPRIDLYYSIKDEKIYPLKPKRKETIKIGRCSTLLVITNIETNNTYYKTTEGYLINSGLIPFPWLERITI